MNIDSNTMVSISEANQNFSKVARLVDQYGSAVILKVTVQPIGLQSMVNKPKIHQFFQRILKIFC